MPVYMIINGPDGGSLFFFRIAGLFLSDSFSLDDPFKSAVDAIRIAMMMISNLRQKIELRGEDLTILASRLVIFMPLISDLMFRARMAKPQM